MSGAPQNPNNKSVKAKLFMTPSRCRKGPMFLLLCEAYITKAFPDIAISAARKENVINDQNNPKCL